MVKLGRQYHPQGWSVCWVPCHQWNPWIRQPILSVVVWPCFTGWCFHGSYKKLKPFFKDFSRNKFIFQGPFMECHVTCLTKWIILYAKLVVFQCPVLLFQFVSAHILAHVQLCLFYTRILCNFFTKLDWKNTLTNLHNATLLRHFRLDMLGKIQGLFKDWWIIDQGYRSTLGQVCLCVVHMIQSVYEKLLCLRLFLHCLCRA